MTKYIVKNCPAYRHGGCQSENVNFKINFECCIKNTDCQIKQVVEMCKKYSYIFSERGLLASLILHSLQVQEVE